MSFQKGIWMEKNKYLVHTHMVLLDSHDSTGLHFMYYLTISILYVISANTDLPGGGVEHSPWLEGRLLGNSNSDS